MSNIRLVDTKGENSPNSKLTDDKVRQIRALSTEHLLSYATLAKRFGCNKTTIRRIVKRQSWSHIE